jgi:hypothetical protein
MSSKKLRFILGMGLLSLAFVFMGSQVSDQNGGSCFDCASMETGVVDIYVGSTASQVMVQLTDGDKNQAEVAVDPMTRKSLLFPKGQYTWKAWTLDTLTPEGISWDWGYVYVQPGITAEIRPFSQTGT